MYMLTFYTAGESHGRGVFAFLDGIPAGLHVEKDLIDADLARRQMGYGRGGRMKIEQDRVDCLSGVRGGAAPSALDLPESLLHSLPCCLRPVFGLPIRYIIKGFRCPK